MDLIVVPTRSYLSVAAAILVNPKHQKNPTERGHNNKLHIVIAWPAWVVQYNKRRVRYTILSDSDTYMKLYGQTPLDHRIESKSQVWLGFNPKTHVANLAKQTVHFMPILNKAITSNDVVRKNMRVAHVSVVRRTGS